MTTNLLQRAVSLYQRLPLRFRLALAPAARGASRIAWRIQNRKYRRKPVFNWVHQANQANRLLVITSGFPFDELVNQRPINAAKHFANAGYTVLFVRWQWNAADVDHRDGREVFEGVIQVPLIEWNSEVLSGRPLFKAKDKLFCINLPAATHAQQVYNLRKNGFYIWYDCMDDWEEFSREGQAPWFKEHVELDLVAGSDLVTCVTGELASKFADIRTDIRVSPNGYYPHLLGELLRPENALKETKVGYFGHLTESWFDWEMVFQLAEANPNCIFEIIGYGQGNSIDSELSKYPNLQYIGKVEPKLLSKYVNSWSHAILPFREGKLSRAVDPIKIYEYIHFGLRTFVTGVSSVREYPGVYFSTRNDAQDSFGDFIENRENLSPEQREVFLKESTWTSRFMKVQAWKDAHKGLATYYE